MTPRPTTPRTHFTLPRELGATEPPEQRGLARDEVRLLIAAADRQVRHALFRDIAAFLQRATSSWSTPPPPAPRRSTGGRPTEDRSLCTSPTRYRTEVTGSWSCAHPAGPRRSETRVPARSCGCPAV